ncbi:MAG: AAA family ATPase [Solirubrobacterales bacterium]|nr:AAA family ATPase [Solirubrobacterales bacterium]
MRNERESSTAGPSGNARGARRGGAARGARCATDWEGDTLDVAQRVTSSRFIGRRPELAELERALSGGGEELPALVFLAGESGVGKTRLLRELASAAEERGARALGGACIELGEGELPYAPLVTALRPLQRGDDPVLDQLSDATRAELSRLIPELGEPPGEPEAERGEAQRRLFDAFLELVARLGEQRPVLLWIEDIHWADRSTRSFLRFLAASLGEERVLVVATYRSDELHRRHPLRPMLAELERSPRARRIELERFDRGELGDQLADILGATPERDVVERMYGRSDGNPLFTEELLAAGVDARGPLPPSLREALLLRVERLPGESQGLLRLLAAVGRAGHDLLAEAGELDRAELSASLREAVAAQIVVADDAGRFGFRHALLREVVYDDLLPGERAELHLDLARALERLAPHGDGAWTASRIAYHYDAAGDQPRALTSALAAAKAVQRLHAYGEAAGLLDRALELWRRVPEPEQLTGIDLGELLTRAGRAHYRGGEDEAGAAALYGRALDEIDERAEPERAATVLTALATVQWGLGQADRSRASQRRGLELLPEAGDSPAHARLFAQRVRFLLLQGRFREVRDEAPQALDVARRAGLQSETAGLLNRLGCALFALGDDEAGRGRCVESIEVARRAGSSDDLGTAYMNYADALHIHAGRSAEAREVALRGLAEVGDLVSAGTSRSLGWLRLALAEIDFELGDWGSTADELRRAGSPRGGVWLAHARLRRAQLALGRGAEESARADVEQAEELLADALEPQYIAVLGALAAELDRRAGDLEGARGAVDRGIDRIQFCSEDEARLAQLATAGLSVEADAAERADDLGDADAEAAAIARAEMMVELVRAAAQDGGRPVQGAYLAAAEAELARARGEDDRGRWATSVAAWEALERPYPRAVARWRQAQAELAAGDRDAAAASTSDAIAAAERLGARWLADEARGLAARGRLSLAAAEEREPDVAGEPPEPFGLTPRERQVLGLLASGATNREIAGQLYMAEKTASVHVSRILSKLDVRSRTEAAAVAHRQGLTSDARSSSGAVAEPG